jgi:hypothetical protein
MFENQNTYRCKFTAALPPNMASISQEAASFSLIYYKAIKGSAADQVKQAVASLESAFRSILKEEIDRGDEDAAELFKLIDSEVVTSTLSSCILNLISRKEFESREQATVSCVPEGKEGAVVTIAFGAVASSIFVPSGTDLG